MTSSVPAFDEYVRHDDFDVVGESINREIPAIDSQDLLDSRIGIDDDGHYSVDVRERLISVLGQYVPGPLVGSPTRLPDLKQSRGVIDQPKTVKAKLASFRGLTRRSYRSFLNASPTTRSGTAIFPRCRRAAMIWRVAQE